MAGYYTGQNGHLWLDQGGNLASMGTTVADAVAQVQSWSINIQQAMIGREALGYTDRVIVPGVRSLTGSAKILYYADGATGTNNKKDEPASWLINKIMKKGGDSGDADNDQSDLIAFRLGLGGRGIKFAGYITSYSMSCSVGEVVAADISFEADGAIVENTLAG